MLKKTLQIAFLLISISLVATHFCNKIIVKHAKDKLYTDVNEVPYHKCGLLLGTGKFLRDNRINLYYTYRVTAAAELLKANKIKYLVISGDNSTKGYDEPTSMRADLIAAGIDSTRIFLDYAGFRTLDSVVRLKKVFGQDSVTIISQKFHNERALYLAEEENIVAVGYNAADVGVAFGRTTALRERLARVKLFLDQLLGTKPKFLGKKVLIPA